MRLGLNVKRVHELRYKPNPSFLAWWEVTCKPGYPMFSAIEAEALNESLTRWDCLFYVTPLQPGLDDLPIYREVVVTPPARSEWLVDLSGGAA